MLECKSMAMPMNNNLKLLSIETSERVEMTHYRKIIGSLMYLMNTRPNIFFSESILSQYLVKPRWVDLIAAKHMMRYIEGTINLGLYYGRDHDHIFYGYMDPDWAGSATERKSTLDGCYCMGSTMISWCSKKQPSVAFSTTEVECITDCSSSREVIWLWKLMSGLFDMDLDTTIIICDN